MKRMIRVSFIYCLLLFSIAVTTKEEVHANDGENTNPTGFVVESIIPENQIEKDKTYFHLAMEPNQKQTIQVRVKSTRKEPSKVKVAVTDAVTGTMGTIDYGQKSPVLDPSLENPMTSIVSVEEGNEEIIVENFEEKIVNLTIEMPEGEFEGVKLGAIRFILDSEEEKDEQQVVSNYGYTVGIVLSEDRTDPEDGGDLKLNQVSAKVVDGEKAIAAKLQNDQPKVLSDLAISMVVTKEGDKEFKKEEKRSNMRMAPNSNFDYAVKWGMENMKPGKYNVHIYATSKDRVWEWNEVVEVSNEVAKKVNDEAAYKLLLPSWVPIVTIIFGIALVVLIGYFIMRGKKWKKRGVISK